MPSEMKTPGGLAFEVVLKEADAEAAKKRPTSPPSSKGTPKTLDNIKSKLEAAEERRKSLESTLVAKVHKHNEDELKLKQTKAQEKEEAFRLAAEEELKKKLIRAEEKKKELEQKEAEKIEAARKKLQQVQDRKKEIGANGDSPTEECK